jgi:hypothetical protein
LSLLECVQFDWGEAHQLLRKVSGSVCYFWCVLQFLIKLQMKIDLMKFINYRFFSSDLFSPTFFELWHTNFIPSSN